ncbi:uncharacterized protein LOC142549757 isoform X2 [Primulina tabacum]|uniref:uncharacterized protein LOC142549757 isoform X2 n=1 Tax=Primulina tabacum TaxID=48773 RepID=UPI003F5A43BD
MLLQSLFLRWRFQKGLLLQLSLTHIHSCSPASPSTKDYSRPADDLSPCHFFSLTVSSLYPMVCAFSEFLGNHFDPFIVSLFRFADAMGVSILDRYVKKKNLDPLETYIPAVLLTGLQMKELEHSLEVDQPKFADCRNLLRSGPASSFRVNIRAVAQYASDAGNGKPAFSAVDQCLRALEELDSLLLQASRSQSKAPIESMKLKIVAALDAMDSLLKFVPSEVLDKAKAMADAYFIPEEYLAPENLDPKLKRLESIL